MLSKSYTFSYIESLLRVLVNELGKDKIQAKTVLKLVNLKTRSLAQLLNGAQDPFYQKTVDVTLAASKVTSTVRTGKGITAANYISDVSHGLTVADVGKRVVVVDTAGTKAGLFTIVSIYDVNNFVVDPGFSTAIVGTIDYAVLSQHDGTNVDLSSYSIANIVKLEDSVNGFITPAGYNEISMIASLDDNSESVFYNHSGEVLILKKGSDVSTWGTLSLTFNRNPDEVTTGSDYIDMKDEYVPLLVDMVKLDMYQLANADAPPALSTGVENKVQSIMNSVASRQAELEKAKKTSK